MFTNKIVLITGGSGGLGKNLAINYAKQNAKIINLSRDYSKMEKLNLELNKINSLNNKFYSVDVSDYRAIENIKNTLKNNHEIPDIIINNAAGNFLSKFENLSANGFNRVVDIVLKGNFNITHCFGKELIKTNNKSVILNILTTYTSTGCAYAIPSAAAKSGVESMMKSLSVEWGKNNVRFVGIAPGGMENTGGIEKLDRMGFYNYYNKINNPSSRLAKLDEISDLALFLTSEKANYINGETITIDGGEKIKNSGQFNFLQNIPFFERLI